MTGLTRRQFLIGSGSAALYGGALRFGFAKPGSFTKAASQEVLISIFLRGGMDGLSLLPPRSGDDYAEYQILRPDLYIPDTSSLIFDAAVPFGLHPAATGLQDLYQSNRLAIVHACGLSNSNRSHFDAQLYMDLGTPGVSNTSTGWLTRHLASAENLPENPLIPTLAAGWYPPASLLNEPRAVTTANPTNFDLNWGHWAWEGTQADQLNGYYQPGVSSADTAGSNTLAAMNVMRTQDWDGYIPGNGVVYPDSTLANMLRMTAQMIKLDVGLRTVTVDRGGWDTHNDEGVLGGNFEALVQDLSDSLYAFFADIAGTHSDHVTAAVGSEFGRRCYQNGDFGTDHGYGNIMLVMGDNVNPGVHGVFPGLAPEQLYQGDDVAVTTDFRRILSEILIRRMGNPYLGYVFPGYTDYAPLGVVQGADLEPDLGEPQMIFNSSFESFA